jgi:hypothetical protein
VACSRDAIVMVEGGGAEVSEDVIIDALMFAHKEAQPLLDLQEKLRAAVGKPKREFTPPAKDPVIVDARVGPSRRRRSRPRWRSATSRRGLRITQEEDTCASWSSTTGKRIDGRATTTSAHHLRGRRAAARTARRCSRAARPRRW